MKRIALFLCLFISTLCSFALETKKVAILEVVDKENKLSYHQKLMLRSRLAEEVNKASGFETYDRSNIDAIMSEHNFQRTGFVSPDQIRQLGKMAGASYILVIEGAVSSQGSLFVSATVLDVESAQMAVAASENIPTTETGLIQGCANLANKLFRELKAETDSSEKAEEAEKAKYYVSKNKKEYIYMGNSMNSKAYAGFLKNNCPEAYKQYMKGKKMKVAGWAVFGTGLAVAAGGAFYKGYLEIQWDKLERLWAITYEREQKYKTYSIVSYAIMGAGGAVLLSSIPILCVGEKRKQKSMSIYNKQCSSPSIPPITFNLTAGQNGLGVAMNF